MNGLLSLLILLPTAGALAILFLPREKTGAIKALATASRAPTFVLSLPLWFARGFRESAGFLFREDLDWIPSLGVRYSLGVDGIAALLILLTTLLVGHLGLQLVHGGEDAREGVLRRSSSSSRRG